MEKQKMEFSDNTGVTEGCDESQRVFDLWNRLEEQKKIDVDKHWKSLSTRMAHERFQTRFWYWVRTSAAILLLPLLIGTGILFWQWDRLKNQPVEQLEVMSAYGVVARMTLPDGSEVWLNSGSLLKYPQRFTGEKRCVFLEGQGYFKVQSDSVHPFDVYTSKGIVISAHGTEFDVQAYADDSCTVATLATGVIKVSRRDMESVRTLKPGEQLLCDRQGRQIELRNVDLAMATAWKDGKIVFNRTPMEKVVKQLSRHFNVDIHLENEEELRGYSYSGTFITEGISEILSLLEQSAPIRCEVQQPVRLADGSYSKKKILIRLR